MVAGVNRWYGIGNMTADPEKKEGESEDRDRCQFSIAINKPGQDSEPMFLDVICWGKLAGQVADFGRKGRPVFIDGEIEVRRYETEDGEKKRFYRIKAYTVRFLDRKPEGEDEEPRRERRQERRPAQEQSRPTVSSRDYDDLPF